MNEKVKPILNFDNVDEIKKFILNNESNIYTGKNIDGQDVIVKLQQSKGKIVETLNSKNWWEWTEFDESGFVIAQGVSPNSNIKK